MLNCAYRLVAPHMFEPVRLDVNVVPTDVIVRPTFLSICNADMRYYLGRRTPEALQEKLPMSLIHEGIGTVLVDQTETFQKGDQVVILPNAPTESDEIIAENYLRTSKFCGSGFDGFMQEYMIVPPERLLLLPDDINPHVAAFTELVSVAVHAITRFEHIAHERRGSVGVWGDGNLGFIVCLLLHTLYPDMSITLIGHNPNKMQDFTFVHSKYYSNTAPADLQIDHAFECCGGDGSTQAIDSIIDHIRPEGTISLLGVSENAVPINTRMILEKGLRLFGSSRSGREDFERTIDIYQTHPEILNYLEALVGEIIPVSTPQDMTNAFLADTRKSMGKTIMRWNV